MLRQPGFGGPGMRFTGSKSWTVRLVRGTYRFGSDPKPLTGTLRVR